MERASAAAGCTWVNGVFAAPAEAKVNAQDHGVLFGDGLFETLRTYGGVPFRLAAHLQRLAVGATELGFPALPAAAELEAVVKEALARAGLPEAHLRITALRGVSRGGLAPSGCEAPTVIISALSLPELSREEGLKATLLWPRERLDRPPPWVKSTSYQRTVLARAELARRQVDEGFYLGEEQTVTEGTASNVFALCPDGLVTPPTDRCLPGVTRAEVLSLAAEQGVPTVERPLRVEELRAAQEVFVTSSLAELRPVVWLDGVALGPGVPGPLWRQLLEGYRFRAGCPR